MVYNLVAIFILFVWAFILFLIGMPLTVLEIWLLKKLFVKKSGGTDNA